LRKSGNVGHDAGSRRLRSLWNLPGDGQLWVEGDCLGEGAAAWARPDSCWWCCMGAQRCITVYPHGIQLRPLADGIVGGSKWGHGDGGDGCERHTSQLVCDSISGAVGTRRGRGAASWWGGSGSEGQRRVEQRDQRRLFAFALGRGVGQVRWGHLADGRAHMRTGERERERERAGRRDEKTRRARAVSPGPGAD
jgi:hypothetical protein